MKPLDWMLVLFVGLKLAGIISWSWWWVLTPLWGPFLAAFILSGITAYAKARKRSPI